MSQNLTTPLSYTRVALISAPIVLSNFAVPLLGAVDTAVIGRTEDAEAIGAVAIGAMIISFVFWLFGFLKMVTSGLSAQAFGRWHTCQNALELTLVLTRGFILAVVIAALLLIFKNPIIDIALWWFNMEPSLADKTKAYFEIRVWSAPVTLATYVVLGWLIGLQRTGAVMVIMLFTNLLNILLDLIFVLNFGWGITGVAYASLISEYTAFGLGIYLVWSTIPHETKGLSAHLKLKDFISLMSANLDLFIRTLCMEISFLTITKLGTKMGDVTLAANAILMHLFTFMAHATDGFGHAAESLTGEALGRKNKPTYIQAFKKTLILSIATALVFSLIYIVFGELITSWFTTLEDVLAVINTHLIWLILIPITSIVPMHFDGVFVGATRTKEMRNAMIFSMICFLIVVYPMQANFGNHGLWAAVNLFMIFRGVFLGAYLPKLFRNSNFDLHDPRT